MKLRIAPLLALALLLFSCGGGAEAGDTAARLKEIDARINELKAELAQLETERNTLAPPKAKQKLVEISPLTAQDFAHYVEIQGYVESDAQVMASPQASGALEQLLVREGQMVQAGQVIAIVDDAIVQNQIAELETRLELAKTNYERRERLWKQKIGTEIQYLEAKTNYEATQKSLAALQAQLALYKVTAPISGKVDEVFPKRGEVVSPSQAVARIVGSGQYKITVPLADNYAAAVNQGDLVKVEIPDIGAEFDGRITNIESTINLASRTFKVEVSLPQNLPGIKPNLVATVKIKDYEVTDAVVVPITVVKGRGKDKYVYIAEQQNDTSWVAKKVSVEIGKTYRERVEVKSGLKPGQQLITVGNMDVADGQLLSASRLKQAAQRQAAQAPAPQPQAK